MLEKKIRRYKLMDAHRELVKQGKLLEARQLLKLLRNGKISLGLGDTDWTVEKLCEDAGCHISYSDCIYIRKDGTMTNFEHMKGTIMNTIAALNQEELRQLVVDTCMDEGDSGAIFSCGICEEIYGECDTIFNGTDCRKKYFNWCNREYKPKADRGAAMDVIKRYDISKDVIVSQSGEKCYG